MTVKVFITTTKKIHNLGDIVVLLGNSQSRCFALAWLPLKCKWQIQEALQ